MKLTKKDVFPAAGRSKKLVKRELQRVAQKVSGRFMRLLPGKPDSPPIKLGVEVSALFSQINPNNGGIHTDDLAARPAWPNFAWAPTRQLERDVVAALAQLALTNLNANPLLRLVVSKSS